LPNTPNIKFPRLDRQILEMIVLGSPPKQIAYELEINVATVNTHIRRLCRRARVSKWELVIYALQHPGALVRDGQCTAGLHPPGCPCDAPYCKGMRRAA
jgi:hypothetical protein